MIAFFMLRNQFYELTVSSINTLSASCPKELLGGTDDFVSIEQNHLFVSLNSGCVTNIIGLI